MSSAGLLALIGGAEFQPGNEPHDEILAASARSRGPAYVVATAAARSRPQEAVRNATVWYQRFGLDVVELRVYTNADARVPATAADAAGAALFYIVGGDPGLVASVLRETPVGDAMIAAWRRGAVLAGSSAGAMALCEHVLVRQKFPGSTERRPVPGLSVLQGLAVLPHHDTFGRAWFSSARAALPGATLIGIDERTCALWDDGIWRCMGPGAITVYRDDDTTVRYRSGVLEGMPAPSDEPHPS
ncbi:MAG: Type 1 glutamine amidotransferase-like domain-containing protein [Candidatus Dormiibacterota bacterium]